MTPEQIKERLEELVKDYELMKKQSEDNALIAKEAGELHRQSYCDGSMGAEQSIINDLLNIIKDI